MQKKFLSSLFLIIALNLLIKPLAIFGIDATVQNRVGTATYGLYFSLLNLSFLFNIFLDLGINNFTTRHIARHPTLVSQYLGKVIGLRFVLFFLYAVITLTIGLAVGYSGTTFFMLLILVFNQLLVTFIAYFRSHFGGLHLFRTDAIVSVLDKALLILICGTLLFTNITNGEFKIEWFIWIQTVCYALTLVTALLILVRQAGIPRLHFNRVFSLVIIRKSLPYALLILLMMIYTRTDSIMLERLHVNGAYEAGVYAQGFRMLDALFMFGMIFSTLLLPIFSRMIKLKANGLYDLIKTSRNLLLGGAILLGFICHSHAAWILDLIYNQHDVASIATFQLLMWVFVAMSISLIYSTLLTAEGDMRTLNSIALIGVAVNISLNIYLIPNYGAVGAAFATLITQIMSSIIQLVIAHRQFHFGFDFQSILSTVVFGICLFGMPYLSDGMNLFALQILVGTALLFALRLINLKQLKQVFLERNEIS